MRFGNIVRELTEEGMPFARESWDGWIEFRDGKCLFYDRQGEREWSPTWDDITATDWSIVRALSSKGSR